MISLVLEIEECQSTLVNVRHLRPREGLDDPVSISCDWVGYHV